MYKTIASTLAVTALAFLPFEAHADLSDSITRAKVTNELRELAAVGYNPSSDHTTYPANIQAAEARLEARRNASATGSGGVNEGSSDAGDPMSRSLNRPTREADPVDFNRP